MGVTVPLRYFFGFFFFLGLLEYRVLNVGIEISLVVLFDIFYDCRHFLCADEATLQTLRLVKRLRIIKHIAFTKKFFSAAFAQNRAAVRSGFQRKRYARRQVRLNRAGDDVNGRALRRNNKVYARSARKTCKRVDFIFDIPFLLRHKVSKFVKNNDDSGKFHDAFVFACVLIVFRNISCADSLEQTESSSHFVYRPVKRVDSRRNVVDCFRHEKVRDTVVRAHFNHLRVNENKF